VRDTVDVLLRPWTATDRGLLHRLLGDPAMTAFLGGPESPEQIERRHQRYLELGDGEMLAIEQPAGTPVGSIGYWTREGQDQRVWETGWSVLPEYQRRGIATAAIRALVDRIRGGNDVRPVHAYPRVDNVASNRICEKAGFRMLGEFEFEYPKGNPILCKDWVIDPSAR
jgi:RimJ/RimL family protein N-acetyltransferase